MAAAVEPLGKGGAVAPGSEADQTAPVDHDPMASKNFSALTYVIMVTLVSCFELHKNNLFVYANRLNGNANEQSYWEDEIKNIKDPTINPNDSNSTLTKKNAEMQENGSIRSDDEDIIMTLSNQAHVLCGQAQQETQENTQCSSIISMNLKALATTGDGIAKMTGS